MEFNYTEHAEEKLQRADIKKFQITKETIENSVLSPDYPSRKTFTGETAVVSNLTKGYILRVICVRIGEKVKVITFHVAKTGRYGGSKE